MKFDRATLYTTGLVAFVLLLIGACSGPGRFGDAPRHGGASDNGSPSVPPSDPAFYPLLSSLHQMTTAPVMLPRSLPPELRNVAILSDTRDDNDPSNDGSVQTTHGDRYGILFLSDPPDPYLLVQDYVHASVGGRLTAGPASDYLPDHTRGGAEVVQLEDVTLPDDTVAELQRVEPPEGVNYGTFYEGKFEKGDIRYTLRLEFPDTPEGDLARQVLSTMVEVPDAHATTESGREESPTASGDTPLGSRLAFASARDGDPEIYVMASEGERRTRLTDDPSWDVDPAFFPDGSEVAFTSSRDGNYEIYSVSSDGSGLANLTGHPANDVQAAVSPDGSKIAFASVRDGNAEIYVMNPDGTDQERLTDNPAWDLYPVFSPDGRQIAFTSNRDGGDEIYVMGVDGTRQTRITANETVESEPVFSPDGDRLVFRSDREDNSDIYAMNSDGTGQTRLTDSPAWDLRPAFSPDGSKVAFVSTRDGSYEIYVMNPDGTDQRRLTFHQATDHEPAFPTQAQR